MLGLESELQLPLCHLGAGGQVVDRVGHGRNAEVHLDVGLNALTDFLGLVQDRLLDLSLQPLLLPAVVGSM